MASFRKLQENQTNDTEEKPLKTDSFFLQESIICYIAFGDERQVCTKSKYPNELLFKLPTNYKFKFWDAERLSKLKLELTKGIILNEKIISKPSLQTGSSPFSTFMISDN